MPPKPKFTKEEIVQASYEILKDRGMDAVVAREVGKQLGTTTGPVFTYFDTMEELKTEVHELARRECMAYLKECLQYDSAFKEFGMRWIRFAKENPHAYMLLFMTKSEKPMLYGFMDEQMVEIIDSLVVEIQKFFGLKEADAKELIQDMCIFAQGLASMCINGLASYDELETSKLLSRVCLSRVAGCKIMDDSINMQMIKGLMGNPGRFPQKKES